MLSILLLVSVVANSKPNQKKDRFHLIVEGKFIAKKHITYTIMKEDNKGVFVVQERIKAKKYYHIECNVGERYIVRFEDKEHNVKFLMIEPQEGGYFVADVDFSRSHDAKLYLTKNGYSLLPLTSSTIARN